MKNYTGQPSTGREINRTTTKQEKTKKSWKLRIIGMQGINFRSYLNKITDKDKDYISLEKVQKNNFQNKT